MKSPDVQSHAAWVWTWLVVLAVGTSASAGVISEWNSTTIELTAKGGTNYATRIDAIEATAVYNAVAAVDHCGALYHDELPLAGSPSAGAAACAAAHDVLVAFYPASTGDLDDKLDATLRSLNMSNTEIADGTRIGAKAAADLLALRNDDGSEKSAPYWGVAEPGKWRPTPRTFSQTFAPQWATLKPFVLLKPSQFRPPPPPALDSDEFKAALQEIKMLGAGDSQVRTPEQTNVAEFWKQNAELCANQAARDLAAAKGLKLDDEARMFALVDLAIADVCIADWDAKMTYSFWRPVTALNADADGKVTNAYGSWRPLLNTPSHPSYVCNHCGVATAGLEVLIRLYGDDALITFHTKTPNQADRTLKMSEAIQQNAMSRLLGGIHYRFDNEAGIALGKKVGDYVFDHALPKN